MAGGDRGVEEGEEHLEKEEETVSSEEYKNRKKGDSGADELDETRKGNRSVEKDNTESKGDKHRSRSGEEDGEHEKFGASRGKPNHDDHSDNTDNMAQTNNNGEELKESKTKFSVWSTDYSNGYEIEDSNTEIRFPEFFNDKRINSNGPVDETGIELTSSGQQLASGSTAGQSWRNQVDTANGRRVLADSDLFALREHIERRIRESLEERFGHD